MVRRFYSLFLILILTLAMTCSVFADYIHEYFRYTVEDESITITGYYGTETTVYVPSMIGGNPVNVIATDAFANNSNVTIVYLPDTIMSIEPGAFAAGQSVLYEDSSIPADNFSETEEIISSSVQTVPLGVYDENGNLLTTDDENNLIFVDSQGNETVLDDSQDYYREYDENGNISIHSESGEAVLFLEDGTISFADGENNKVTITPETISGQSAIVDFESEEEEEIVQEKDNNSVENTAVSESEVNEDSGMKETSEITQNSVDDYQADEPVAKSKTWHYLWTVIVAAGIIIVVFVFLRVKRKH